MVKLSHMKLFSTHTPIESLPILNKVRVDSESYEQMAIKMYVITTGHKILLLVSRGKEEQICMSLFIAKCVLTTPKWDCTAMPSRMIVSIHKIIE